MYTITDVHYNHIHVYPGLYDTSVLLYTSLVHPILDTALSTNVYSVHLSFALPIELCTIQPTKCVVYGVVVRMMQCTEQQCIVQLSSANTALCTVQSIQCSNTSATVHVYCMHECMSEMYE